MKRILLFTVLLSCFASIISAQITISGTVIDSETGAPIIGANIRVNHSLNGCTTNAKGEFILRDLPNSKQAISITHVSYAPQAYTTDKSEKNVIIRMIENHVNIGQVVVTGTGTHHRMTDSPVPVTVITAKDFHDANITTLQEALTKLSPSFSFVTNGMGTTMTLNGMPDDYILVLENGKKLAGDDTYTRIDLANVKRIEVLNGAASALYGSDAIAGVINIITDDTKNKVNVSSHTRYSSKNRFTQSVNADFNTGKFGSYTSYQRQQADGWQLSPFVEDKGEEVPTDKEASTGFYSNSVNQQFTYNATNRLSLSLRGSYYNNMTDRPITEYKYNMYHEDYLYGAGVNYMINKSAYIDADFYSDNYTSSYDYMKKSGKFEEGDREQRKRQHYYDATVKGIFKIGKYNKISTGVEYINENLTSESENIDKKKMYTLALFAQDEIKIINNLRALLGLRYIYHENFKNYATPNIALMYKISGFNFRASYASGFRTPTLSELYSSNVSSKDVLTIGNLNLKPEKSNYYSLNAEYVHNRFSVSVTAYLNNIRNMINYRTLSEEEAEEYGHKEVQQRDNIDKARIKGISVSVNGYLGAGFSANAGYSFNDAKNLITDKPIDKSLKHTANVSAQWGHTWNNYRLNVNVNGRIQGERFSERYGYAPKFQLWDLNTRHTINLHSFILEPGVGIENIFNFKDDRPWNSNYATLSPGRAAYISLVLRFKH